MRYVMVPGIDGSGPDHWQTHWQQALGAEALRIDPASWTTPDRADWCSAISALTRGEDEVVLVAHSLGCLAAAHFLQYVGTRVRGAFLVAPPDVTGPLFPRAAAPTFGRPSTRPFGVASLVVASDDDPYCSPARSRGLARAWTSGWVSVGDAGHLNSASGLGAWPEGRRLLTAFIAGVSPRPRPAGRRT